MCSKSSKWLLDIKGGRQERNEREFYVVGFIFTHVQIIFSGSLKGGRGTIDCIASPAAVDPFDCTVRLSDWTEATQRPINAQTPLVPLA